MENLPYVDVEVLLRQSQTIREEATRLMRELRLVEQLQQYGELEMAGSYRWDLMLRPDLDFYVINPAVDLDMALEALNAFVRRGDCHGFGFIESVRGKPWEATPESYPVGYYLGMARDFGSASRRRPGAGGGPRLAGSRRGEVILARDLEMFGAPGSTLSDQALLKLALLV